MNPPANGRQPDAKTRTGIRAAFGVTIASILLCLALACCYLIRFDACAALTILPVWGWLLPATLVAGFSLLARSRRMAAAQLIVWYGFALLCTDEPRSLVRGLLPQRHVADGTAIRVVTLNCGEGSRRAVEEALALSPDVMLLQESPSKEQLEAIARQTYGDEGAVLFGGDSSMLIHGGILEAGPDGPARRNSVRARVRLASGFEMEVVSLRLEPGLVRLDFWSPDCWREQSANRRTRRGQIEAIVADLPQSPPSTPVILGGDFNAPAGDPIYRTLSPRLQDSFSEAGSGWGNTIVNGFPVQRIDQVWISRDFEAVKVVSLPTRHSDHCLVVCDLVIR